MAAACGTGGGSSQCLRPAWWGVPAAALAVLAPLLTCLLFRLPSSAPAPTRLQDMQRPLYMQPADALAYGVIDGVVTPEKKIIDDVKSADQWDKEAGLVAR